MDIKQQISLDLDVPQNLIRQALAGSGNRVRKFHISKRNGGVRTIYQPEKKLKTIQYWLIGNVFDHLPIHSSSAAYLKGTSILSNARRHVDNRYFLKMDFKSFFPSIKWSDLKPIISTWHKSENPPWELTSSAMDLVRRSCFYRDDSLPIGYPSSPVISNVVMSPFDKRLENILSNSSKFGDVVYTRYADDMVVSTDRRNVCDEIRSTIVSVVKETDSPQLKLNHNKTRMGSRSSGTAVVTGLRICSDGHITIHRSQKDHIRLLLSLYSKQKLRKCDEGSLLGHLAYVRHVAPQFYSKLQGKYFQEIQLLRSSHGT